MPAKSGRESRRRGRNRTGNARKRAPAKCERQRRGSTGGGTGKRNRNSWRSALRRRNPPPCAGSILLLSHALTKSPQQPSLIWCKKDTPVISSPCAGALPALHLRSLLRCTGALPRAVLALSAALHWRSLPRFASGRLAQRRRYTLGYACALCRRRRYSLRFVALSCPSTVQFPLLCRHSGTPRPLAFNTTCGGAARWGASWWGGLRCSLPQLNYCLV